MANAGLCPATAELPLGLSLAANFTSDASIGSDKYELFLTPNAHRRGLLHFFPNIFEGRRGPSVGCTEDMSNYGTTSVFKVL